MSQWEMVRIIMESLKPTIVNCIGMLENLILDELKKNIRKIFLLNYLNRKSNNPK